MAKESPRVWRAGYDAGVYGDSVECCPYAPWSHDAWSWLRGWREGDAWRRQRAFAARARLR